VFSPTGSNYGDLRLAEDSAKSLKIFGYFIDVPLRISPGDEVEGGIQKARLWIRNFQARTESLHSTDYHGPETIPFIVRIQLQRALLLWLWLSKGKF
jgi:hypothetical protein